MVTKLTARVFHDTDGTWTIQFPELTSASPSGVTIIATGSATTWRGVKKAASDLASVWLDVEPSEVAVTIEVDAPADILEMVEAGARAEEEGNAARARGAALRKEAVQRLRAEGYPLEAAASVLGVSHQRVQQLAS